MKRRLPDLDSDQLIPAAFFGGLLLIAVGVALVSVAAGLVVAGALLVAGAWRAERASEADE